MPDKTDDHSVLLNQPRSVPPVPPRGHGAQEQSAAAPRDGSPRDDMMSLANGTVLNDKYEIVGQLGSGGFGIVYEARDRDSGDDIVAIKEYLPAFCARPSGTNTVVPRVRSDQDFFDKGLAAFIGEARVLRDLDHPNIVRVFHWFKQHGTAYIVMRRLHGQSLEQVIESGAPIDAASTLKSLKMMLSALELVHARGLLHRDISPSNIFVLGDGTPSLIDFGAARATIGRVSQRLTAIARHGYTPPEQYDEYGLEAQTPASDIYALGATFYHLISGNKPMSSILILRYKDEKRLLPLAEAAAGKLPPQVLASVDKAMNITQSERWQSVGEWRMALDPPEPPPKKPIWRYVTVAFVVVLLYVFFVGV
jgi:serine/threonine protein kinase